MLLSVDNTLSMGESRKGTLVAQLQRKTRHASTIIYSHAWAFILSCFHISKGRISSHGQVCHRSLKAMPTKHQVMGSRFSSVMVAGIRRLRQLSMEPLSKSRESYI